MKIPYEILDIILNNIEDIESFINLYPTCKYIYSFLNTQKFYKKMLNLYKVDYKDSTNFIYIQNNVRENWYRLHPYDKNSEHDYKRIFDLYMKFFFHKKIDCSYEKDNGVIFNVCTRKLEININTININRTSGFIEFPEMSIKRNKPSDKDYRLQMLISKLKKKWSFVKRKYNYSSREKFFHPVLYDLKQAYDALIFHQYDYDIGDTVYEDWDTIETDPSTSDDEEYIYRPIISQMSRISSIPIYPHLQELTCMNQQIVYLPSLPNLIYLNCSSNLFLSLLPDLPKLKHLVIYKNMCLSVDKRKFRNLEILEKS
jgi:Leucine-rich repeat (LRR) protein